MISVSDAKSGLHDLLKFVEGKPLPMARLALAIMAKGQKAAAHDLCARAMALAPNNAEVLSQDVPSYYFTLIRDAARHELYEGAFRRIIRPTSRVLDIGSGTGLFAMMAARAGAAEVVTCESNPIVAETVANVIAKNGF